VRAQHPAVPVTTRLVGAVGAGALLWLSFPPRHLWFLAPVGVALLVVVLRGRGVRAGFAYGYAAGLGYLLPLLPWVGIYVGALPWVALAAFEAVAVGLFGVGVALVGRRPGAPVWIACAWVTTEALRSRVPLGGFPWGRLAFSQPQGPLLALASLGGAPGLSFTVALMGAGAASLLTRRPRPVVTTVGGVLAVALPVLVALTLTPTLDNPASATSTSVAVIQGNVPRLGLDFNAQRAAVLNNHVAETERLAAAVAAGTAPAPTLVVWPENASDIDPLRDPTAAAALTRAAQAVGVPILVGTVLGNPDGTTRNTVLVWDPVTGPGAQVDKRVLVPFGEYLPARALAEKLSPYAARAGHFVPGSGDGTLTLNGVRLAVAICYEVAFDNLVGDSVRAGAQIITVPSNNATFGRSDMTYQQLAMSQVRAVEHGRTVLVAATSGVSAVINPQGHVVDQTGVFTAATLSDRVVLRSDLTLATRLGAIPELAMVLAFTLALLTPPALGLARRRRQQQQQQRQRPPPSEPSFTMVNSK
jgi:apolipoprotein N-acyltransferase